MFDIYRKWANIFLEKYEVENLNFPLILWTIDGNILNTSAVSSSAATKIVSNGEQASNDVNTGRCPFRSFSLGSFDMFDARDEFFVENGPSDENKENEWSDNHNCYKDEIIANVIALRFRFDRRISIKVNIFFS